MRFQVFLLILFFIAIPSNVSASESASSSLTVAEGSDPGFALRVGNIGDRVFDDANGDGVDNAEPGIAGVTLWLKSPGFDNVLGTNDDVIEDTQTSSASGLYLFQNVATGIYLVQIDTASLPANRQPTYDSDGTLDHATIVSFTSGNDQTGIDFGYAVPNTFSGRVWTDLNADGIQDSGESGVSGLVVNMFLGSSATPLQTVTTTGLGEYLFQPVLNGTYRIGIAVGGRSVSPPNVGPDDAVDSDFSAGPPVEFTQIATAGGQFVLDAGVYLLASIGDFAFEDTDGDGIFDGTIDVALPNVGVELVSAGSDGLFGTSDDVVEATTSTNGTGGYQFGGILPGNYIIKFTAPTASHVVTLKDAGANDARDSDADPISGSTPTISVKSGDVLTNWDVGYYQPALLGDFVWEDVNANGVQDSGEPGLGGVVVNLLTASGANYATTTTASNGTWQITNITPGSYEVEVVPPSGFSFSFSNMGTDDAVDSDTDRTTGRTGLLTLTAGSSTINVDSGLFPTAFVHFSSTSSATTDEASGPFGVTAELIIPSGRTLGSAVSITMLDTGSGTTTSGVDHGMVGNTLIVFPAASRSGDTQPGTIQILDDTDLEGNETLELQLSGIVGPAQVDAPTVHTVTITDDDQAELMKLVTSGLTNESGGSDVLGVWLSAAPSADVTVSLSVSNVAEGSVTPSTLTFTSSNWNVSQNVSVTGVNDTVFDGDQPFNVEAVSTSSELAFNGLVFSVPFTNQDNDRRLSGRVWTDSNNDGIQNNSEPGVVNWPVRLLTSSGAEVNGCPSGPGNCGDQRTGSGGTYEFTFEDAATANFSITVAGDPVWFTSANAGSDDTIDSDACNGSLCSGVGSITSISVPIGGESINNDIGLGAASIVELQLTVWDDRNSDGVLGSGDGLSSACLTDTSIAYGAGGANIASGLQISNNGSGSCNLLFNLSIPVSSIPWGGTGTEAEGSLYVDITPHPGTTHTLQDVGSDESLDSDTKPSTGRIAVNVSLPLSGSTQSSFNLTAGLRPDVQFVGGPFLCYEDETARDATWTITGMPSTNSVTWSYSDDHDGTELLTPGVYQSSSLPNGIEHAFTYACSHDLVVDGDQTITFTGTASSTDPAWDGVTGSYEIINVDNGLERAYMIMPASLSATEDEVQNSERIQFVPAPELGWEVSAALSTDGDGSEFDLALSSTFFSNGQSGTDLEFMGLQDWSTDGDQTETVTVTLTSPSVYYDGVTGSVLATNVDSGLRSGSVAPLQTSILEGNCLFIAAASVVAPRFPNTATISMIGTSTNPGQLEIDTTCDDGRPETMDVLAVEDWRVDGDIVVAVNVVFSSSIAQYDGITGTLQLTALDSEQWGSIGDYVWRDTDGNGEQDETESGIEGVSIQLRRYAADGNTLLPAIATEVVVSDANGWFQFFDLPEGEYGIEPDLSSLGAGYSFTRYNQGNSITRDSNVVPATGRARINLRRTGNGLAFDVGIIRSLLAATRLQFISDLQGYSGEVDFFACSTLAAPDLKAGQALSLTLLDGGDNPDSTCSTSKLEVLIKTKNGEQLFKETLSLPILESGQYGDYLLVLSGSFDSSDNLPIGVTPYLMKDESALFVNNFPDDGSQIAIKRLFSAEVPPALQEPIPVKYKESISGLKTVLSNAIPYHATGFEILKGGERLEAFEFPDNDSLDQTTYVMSAQPGAVNARPTLRRTTRKGGSQAVPSALASATSTEQLSRGPDAEIPAVFKLEANYPNPFSSTTTIPFRVAATGPVTIDLFDSIGRHITSLLDEPISSGLHQIDVSAAGLLNGVYFYRMQASGFRDVGTLIVRK